MHRLTFNKQYTFTVNNCQGFVVASLNLFQLPAFIYISCGFAYAACFELSTKCEFNKLLSIFFLRILWLCIADCHELVETVKGQGYCKLQAEKS